jgi:hypothetical protein
MLRTLDNEYYKGNFKDGSKLGIGTCLFKSGAIYKGEWKNNNPHG